MKRECTVKFKVDGVLFDMLEKYDMHVVKSPARVNPPIRKFEEQAYPETAAVEVDPRTVKQPFDYKVSFLFFGNEDTANQRIRAFFDEMFEVTPGSDILVAKEVELQNHWKGVKMSGFAQTWDEKTYEIEGEKGVVAFDFTLRVTNPNTFMPL